MVHVRDLQSFVAAHERKLENKIETVATQNRLDTIDHPRASDPVSKLGLQNHQGILEHKFAAKTRRHRWPMQYEDITPHAF